MFSGDAGPLLEPLGVRTDEPGRKVDCLDMQTPDGSSANKLSARLAQGARSSLLPWGTP